MEILKDQVEWLKNKFFFLKKEDLWYREGKEEIFQANATTWYSFLLSPSNSKHNYQIGTNPFAEE